MQAGICITQAGVLFIFWKGASFSMASQNLINTIQGYENHILQNGITIEPIDAYIKAVDYAINTEKDVEYGLQLSTRAKELIEQLVLKSTGGSIWELEKYAFTNKTWCDILDKHYKLLLIESQNKVLDSAFQYLEKKRQPKERFYMPRRKHFLKFGLIQALQGMIDDKYDILCISLPPGSGKTTVEKFFNALVAGWFPLDFNLFYSHSGDITRMYYDGVYQIVTDTQEYSWSEIFPDLSVSGTNAKLEQFNIGKYKPFPSVQCTSVKSNNAGKVRASKFLLVDDMIGGIEQALNPNILEKLWNNYTVDARQRKTQDTDGRPCKEIHIATRWSVQDVIGKIQRMYAGNERVKSIAVPDIDPQTGESNFDYEYGGFTKEFFADQQLLMDEISYRCLYKQDPIEREGLLFPEDKVRRYLELPKEKPDEILGQCDTKGKGTDYMVMPCLYRYGDDYYCVDTICDNGADYEVQYEALANMTVHHEMNNCEYESNAGGDRVAAEVSKRVEEKGWICNITTHPTETNKEARIFQCSNWILQHIIFKDKTLYSSNEQYGIMMRLLLGYSISGKNPVDDVPDVFSNFALRMKRRQSRRGTTIIQSPII